MELSEKKQSILIERIRMVMIDYVYQSDELPKVLFSDFMKSKIDYSYKYLSNLFSKVQDITLEHYIINLRADRTKELIVADKHTFSEIANKLHYSSLAHLSNQFKKSTGLTLSQYKTSKAKNPKFSKSLRVTQ